MVEIHDSSATVSAVTIAKVLTTLAAPILIAAGLAISALKQEHYGNNFTSWLTILVCGVISAAGWLLLFLMKEVR